MKTAPALFSGLLIAAFAIGWATAPMPQAAPHAMAQPPHAAHHGATLAAAVRRLEGLYPPPTPNLSFVMASATPAPPPEPDIVVVFRRDLTAITRSADGALQVWIIDPSTAVQRRALQVGAPYKLGWRVGRIDDVSITLHRRGERRRIAFVDSAAPADAAPTHADTPAIAAHAPATTRRRLPRPMNDG